MLQASLFDGHSFDPFSFQQDGLAPPEIDISRGQVSQALVVALVVVVGDEGLDLGLEPKCPLSVLKQKLWLGLDYYRS